MGRHSDYTEELAQIICDKLANGASLRAICREDGFPSIDSVNRWLRANQDFREQYARAREDQADGYFDEIIEIADKVADGVLLSDAARVQIDARKWVAGKLRPKKYGDKTTVETTATVTVSHTRKLDISTLSDDQLDALEGALRATVAQLAGPIIEQKE